MSATEVAIRPPTRSAATETSSQTLRRFLVLTCELLLIVLVVREFQIEERRQLIPLMYLVAGGFVIHHRLRVEHRLPFFLALSLAGLVLVLGWQNAAWITAIGTGLIGVCHLPVAFALRVMLLLGIGGLLALSRAQFPQVFWPVLGSMFMFRLMIYLREIRHERVAVPVTQRLAYFFLLPNACFPFFPIVDYRVFRETYRNEDADRIAQRGIEWILRGIVHLLLYRVIKYHLLPSPAELVDLQNVLLFLVTNYALYLRISGHFHLITGILHLFGFNLPRTHYFFFLASSFTDIWRRINIYWKDFLTKQFFYPAFFRLRRWGDYPAVVASVVFVFLCTWLLHSYQVFWLLGDFPLTGRDAALWLSAGTLVAINAVYDYRAARRPRSRHQRLTIAGAARYSLQVAGMFLLISLFWACWTIPGFPRRLLGAVSTMGASATAFGWGMGVLAAVVAIGVATQFARRRLLDRGVLPLDLSFGRSAAASLMPLGLLLVVGNPAVQNRFSGETSRVLASLKLDAYTDSEAARHALGYYEELAEINLQSDPLVGMGHSASNRGPLHFSDSMRDRADLLEAELIPGWSGKLAGARLSINRWGMRDGHVTKQKPPNTYRIAVVGSSVVMGYGVRDTEVFDVLLEEKLNAAAPPDGPRYEVLNFGVGRYRALHAAAALREKIFEFQPDAVWYVAHQGEFQGPPGHLAKASFHGYELPYACLHEIIRRAGVTSETSWGATEARLQRFARDIVVCAYRGIVADCRARGVLPVWVYLPIPGVVDVSIDPGKMVALAEDTGFVAVDLSGWEGERRPVEVKLNEEDYHANALGHRLIADEFFEAVQRRPEFLPGARD